LHKFSVELLDENFNVMQKTENQLNITDSGVSPVQANDRHMRGYGGDS